MGVRSSKAPAGSEPAIISASRHATAEVINSLFDEHQLPLHSATAQNVKCVPTRTALAVNGDAPPPNVLCEQIQAQCEGKDNGDTPPPSPREEIHAQCKGKGKGKSKDKGVPPLPPKGKAKGTGIGKGAAPPVPPNGKGKGKERTLPLPLAKKGMTQPGSSQSQLPLGRRLNMRDLGRVPVSARVQGMEPKTVWKSLLTAHRSSSVAEEVHALKMVFSEMELQSTTVSKQKLTSVKGKSYISEDLAMKFGILLKALPIRTEVLARLLQFLDFEKMNVGSDVGKDIAQVENLVSQLEQLLRVLPKPEMARPLLEFNGPPEDLRDIERDILPLLRLSRLEQRMRMFIISLSLQPKQANLMQQCKCIQDACQELRHSPTLRGILAKVLVVFNFVNFGVTEGHQSRIFDMSALLSLTEFKTKGGPFAKFHGLHWIVLQLLAGDENAYHVDWHLRELPTLAKAANLNLADIKSLINSVREEVDFLRREKQNHGIEYGGTSEKPISSESVVQSRSENDLEVELELAFEQSKLPVTLSASITEESPGTGDLACSKPSNRAHAWFQKLFHGNDSRALRLLQSIAGVPGASMLLNRGRRICYSIGQQRWSENAEQLATSPREVGDTTDAQRVLEWYPAWYRRARQRAEEAMLRRPARRALEVVDFLVRAARDHESSLKVQRQAMCPPMVPGLELARDHGRSLKVQRHYDNDRKEYHQLLLQGKCPPIVPGLELAHAKSQTKCQPEVQELDLAPTQRQAHSPPVVPKLNLAQAQRQVEFLIPELDLAPTQRQAKNPPVVPKLNLAQTRCQVERQPVIPEIDLADTQRPAKCQPASPQLNPAGKLLPHAKTSPLSTLYGIRIGKSCEESDSSECLSEHEVQKCAPQEEVEASFRNLEQLLLHSEASVSELDAAISTSQDEVQHLMAFFSQRLHDGSYPTLSKQASQFFEVMNTFTRLLKTAFTDVQQHRQKCQRLGKLDPVQDLRQRLGRQGPEEVFQKQSGAISSGSQQRRKPTWQERHKAKKNAKHELHAMYARCVARVLQCESQKLVITSDVQSADVSAPSEQQEQVESAIDCATTANEASTEASGKPRVLAEVATDGLAGTDAIKKHPLPALEASGVLLQEHADLGDREASDRLLTFAPDSLGHPHVFKKESLGAPAASEDTEVLGAATPRITGAWYFSESWAKDEYKVRTEDEPEKEPGSAGLGSPAAQSNESPRSRQANHGPKSHIRTSARPFRTNIGQRRLSKTSSMRLEANPVPEQLRSPSFLESDGLKAESEICRLARMSHKENSHIEEDETRKALQQDLQEDSVPHAFGDIGGVAEEDFVNFDTSTSVVVTEDDSSSDLDESLAAAAVVATNAAKNACGRKENSHMEEDEIRKALQHDLQDDSAPHTSGGIGGVAEEDFVNVDTRAQKTMTRVQSVMHLWQPLAEEDDSSSELDESLAAAVVAATKNAAKNACGRKDWIIKMNREMQEEEGHSSTELDESLAKATEVAAVAANNAANNTPKRQDQLMSMASGSPTRGAVSSVVPGSPTRDAVRSVVPGSPTRGAVMREKEKIEARVHRMQSEGVSIVISPRIQPLPLTSASQCFR